MVVIFLLNLPKKKLFLKMYIMVTFKLLKGELLLNLRWNLILKLVREFFEQENFKKNNKGFILQVTLWAISVVSGIFYLICLSLKNNISEPFLYAKESLKKTDLENTNSTVLYEFSLIDKYITNGIILKKEDYFFSVNENEKIWSYPHNLSKESIGGFKISYISPPIDTINFEEYYTFTFELAKEIFLLDYKDNKFLKVSIYTKRFQMNCFFQNETLLLHCNDDNLLINDFRGVGEVLNETI